MWLITKKFINKISGVQFNRILSPEMFSRQGNGNSCHVISGLKVIVGLMIYN